MRRHEACRRFWLLRKCNTEEKTNTNQDNTPATIANDHRHTEALNSEGKWKFVKSTKVWSDRIKKLDEDAHRWTKPFRLFLNKASKCWHNGEPGVGEHLHFLVCNALYSFVLAFFHTFIFTPKCSYCGGSGDSGSIEIHHGFHQPLI